MVETATAVSQEVALHEVVSGATSYTEQKASAQSHLGQIGKVRSGFSDGILQLVILLFSALWDIFTEYKRGGEGVSV